MTRTLAALLCVVDSVLELADALSEEGIEVASAAGDYSVCGVEPASSVGFGAGAGTSPDSGTIAEQLDVVRSVVRDAGWEEEGSDPRSMPSRATCGCPPARPGRSPAPWRSRSCTTVWTRIAMSWTSS